MSRKLQSAESILAVVAAGGYASRLGSARPKSLWTFRGKQLIRYCLEEVLKAGMRKVVLYNNRPEWHHELITAIPLGVCANLVQDRGLSSTFPLVRDAAERSTADHILFLYGHAPRPVTHIRSLLAGDGIAVTVCPESSKRIAIVSPRGLYVEPPYVIPTRLVREISATNWSDFFRSIRVHQVTEIFTIAAEFNFIGEFRRYQRYLAEHYS